MMGKWYNGTQVPDGDRLVAQTVHVEGRLIVSIFYVFPKTLFLFSFVAEKFYSSLHRCIIA